MDKLIKAFNEVMSNKNAYITQEQSGHRGIPDNSYDGEQGEYNEKFIFYKHKDFPEGVFLRETYHTDSYGSGEFLEEIKFVTGKEKMVVVFEAV
jgi:hypothetical protein